MLTYLIRRFLQTIIFVILASLLLYTALVVLMPGGPQDSYNKVKSNAHVGVFFSLPVAGDYLTPMDVQVREMETLYKVDKPWPLDFFAWLFEPGVQTATVYNAQNVPVTVNKGINLEIFGWHLAGAGVLTGDFGVSVGFFNGQPVSDVLGTRWMNTLLLLVFAIVVALVAGVALGLISATMHHSRLDHTLTVLSLAGVSVPPYVLGVLLILFLGIVPAALHNQGGLTWLPWLPVGDIGDPNLGSRFAHLILPVATLALPQIAWISRQTRFAMLDILNQDYIRTAWAKGLSLRQVVLKHAFRNVLIPLITYAAIMVPTLISAVAIVETIFAYGGIGRELFRSLGGCLWADVNKTSEPPPCPASGYASIDYPMALILLVIMIVVVAFSNMIADVLYAVADPRINYEENIARS